MAGTTGNIRTSIKHAYIAACTIALAYYAAAALGGTPQLLRNINTTLVPASSYPGYLGVLGNKVLFGATDGGGPGLWTTDGTAAGTVLVRHVQVTAQLVFPGTPNYVVMGNRGYFVGNDGGANGAQIWSTDGTASGTTPVTNLGASGTTLSPSLYGLFASLVIFSRVDPAGNDQLYSTDGTTSGTQALTSLTGPYSSVSSDFLVVGSKFYFATQGVVGGVAAGQIWVSDGTTAGTHAVANSSGNSLALYHPHGFALIGTSFLYVSDGQLWSVDTTSDTIAAVTPLGGLTFAGNVSENAGLIAMSGYVLCIVANNNAQELWRSDGTSAGTYRVVVANPGPVSFNSQQYPLLQKVGNRVLFIGSDAQYGSQLWSSDGTAANTVRLTDATEPANVTFSIAIYHASLAGIAYLSMPDGAQTTTWSLWRTDGTAAGTMRLPATLPSVDQSEPGLTQVTGDGTAVYVEIHDASLNTSLFKYEPAADRVTSLKSGLSTSTSDGFMFVSGGLYFSSTDPVLGDEPWFSDGTPGGTQLLGDLNPQVQDRDSSPDEFVNFNGLLAFVADDGVHGRELWQSDGTAAGTMLLADINPGAAASNPSHLFVANDGLYFFAVDSSGSSKFMRLSGNPAVVQSLVSLSPPPLPQGTSVAACIFDTPAVLNGKIYFAATDGTTGIELWSTDGTPGGTQLVADINPGPVDSDPCQLTVLDNKLYFSATGPSGNELWTTDGTSAGTQQVLDIAPGAAGSSPSGLTVFNDALYFGAAPGSQGQEMWTSNGQASGTSSFGSFAQGPDSLVGPAGVVNGRLLIAAANFNPTSVPLVFQDELWASDGTTAGTSDLGAQIVGSGFFVSGALAYFASTGPSGVEPWISDGTAAGTHQLAEINPTTNDEPLWFAAFNGITLFGVPSSSSPTQLWRTDGTAAGTAMVANVPPDVPSTTWAQSHRHQLTVGQTFFFVGNEATTGTELYALSNDPPVANADAASSANDQQVTINVLTNDTDSDGSVDPTSIVVTTNPGHGTGTVGQNGTVSYTPASGFSGTDTFAYTIRDNQGATSKPATVTITVTAPTVTVMTGGGTSSSGGHSGGGSLDLLELAVLLAMGGLRLCGLYQRSRSRPRDLNALLASRDRPRRLT